MNLFSCVIIVLMTIFVGDAWADHPPYIPEERGFVAHQNEWGTTSVGLKVGPLILYFEHSGIDPQPAPGWVRTEFLKEIPSHIHFVLDDKDVIDADAARPWLGITVEQLKQLTTAKSVTVVGADSREGAPTITATFQAEDFANLKAFVAYGSHWKAPQDPETNMSAALQAINLRALSREQIRDVKNRLERSLDSITNSEERFDIVAFDESLHALDSRDAVKATSENIANAKAFLNTLTDSIKPLGKSLDLKNVISEKFPTTTVYTTLSLRIDNDAAVLKRLRADTLRLNVVIYAKEQELRDNAQMLSRIQSIVTASGGEVTVREWSDKGIVVTPSSTQPAD